MQLEKYDTYLIFTATRFTKNDLELAKKVRSIDKKCFFIRTKIDESVRAERRKRSFDEQAMLTKIRRNCLESLGDLLTDEQDIFLISNHEPEKWEFAQLTQAILGALTRYQRESMTLSLGKVITRSSNVADGLAWSYYFGYLKLVLPKLEDQITKSDKYRYLIKKKKLFILLPKTCYTYDDIERADDRVKWAGSLPEYQVNRGGIKTRSYKHAVHRIEMPLPDGGVDEYHFVLEYATPLMTLYDMSMHAAASFSHQERDHQVMYQSM